jgi:transcriptional regulator with XRE-family HTH domain
MIMDTWTPERIKRLREAFSLSQVALGSLTGVSGNYIWMLEGGDRNKKPSKTLCLLLDRIEKELQENENGKEDMRHGTKNKRSL